MLLDTRKDTKKVTKIFDAAEGLIEKEKTEFFKNVITKETEKVKVKESGGTKPPKDRKVEKSQRTLFDF